MKTAVEFSPNWIIDAPPEEMSLILKALGGRLREDEKQHARELGDRITHLRAKLARQFADQMETHAVNSTRK